MKSILKNWKTTFAGVAVIVINLFVSKGKIDVATGTAIVSGIGLITAKDHNKTGDGNGQ